VEVLGEEPVFSSSFLSFTRKLSDYYYSSWGEVLQASLPPSFILKSQVRVSLTEKGREAVRKEGLPRAEKELLNFLRDKEYSILFLKRKLKIKNLSALLSRLEKKGLVHTLRDIKRTGHKKAPSVSRSQAQLEMDFSLDSPSRKTADEMASVLGKKVFSSFLLYGPQEKRESVYFYLIRRILEQGRRVLFLVPEIALTQALREQFEKRLGEKVALLHSRLTERMRELECCR
jgi:primosomal protein N' (replication factor Y)